MPIVLAIKEFSGSNIIASPYQSSERFVLLQSEHIFVLIINRQFLHAFSLIQLFSYVFHYDRLKQVS